MQSDSSKYTQHNDIDTMLSLLDQDGFNVHGIMFSNHDLIQALLYCSPFCYSVIQNKYNPGNVNSFMITINPEDEVLMCSAGRQTRIRGNRSNNLNTVMYNQSTGTVSFFVSTGFLFDTFDYKKPRIENDGRFVFEQTGDLVLFRKDLESLMSMK